MKHRLVDGVVTTKQRRSQPCRYRRTGRGMGRGRGAFDSTLHVIGAGYWGEFDSKLAVFAIIWHAVVTAKFMTLTISQSRVTDWCHWAALATYFSTGNCPVLYMHEQHTSALATVLCFTCMSNILQHWQLSCALHAWATYSAHHASNLKLHGSYYFAEIIFPDFSLTFQSQMNHFPWLISWCKIAMMYHSTTKFCDPVI